MEKIEIDKERVLSPGEVIELHFITPGGTWIKATEAAVVEWSLEDRTDFRINHIDYLTPGMVIIEVEVLKTNPVVVTVAVICGAIALAAVAFGWMFSKAYLVSKTVPAQVLSVGVVVVAIVLALVYFRK